MKIKRTIFGSRPEEEVFRLLESRWSPQFRIWPSLPLSTLLILEDNDVTEKERRYFYSTSIDFTLSDSGNSPLLSIEFDGIGGGFSNNGVYLPGDGYVNSMRKIKLDFKLKCAAKVDYPFFVVSYGETESLEQDDRLMILDGIIGQVLAKKEFFRKVNDLNDYYHDKFAEASSLEECELKQETIQDLATCCEVEAELTMDPIARKAAEYGELCHGLGVVSYSMRYLSDPALPDFNSLDDIESLKSRIEAMKHTVREGCQITIEMPGQKIQKTVWVRNFESYGVSASSIARNIAEYLGFKKAFSLLPKM
jgi:hypothetical protein